MLHVIAGLWHSLLILFGLTFAPVNPPPQMPQDNAVHVIQVAQPAVPQSVQQTTNTEATITVNSPAQAPISVPGMSKYTDSDFGFSFWYPSGWSLTQTAVSASQLAYYGDDPKQGLKSFKLLSGTKSVSFIKITSDSGVNELCGSCSDSVYFDSAKHQWMENITSGGFPGGNKTIIVDVSANTMGGLHIINQFIIPLSARNFVLVVNVPVGPLDIQPLIKTIVATDPSVATPVSAAEQIKTIQAEKDAYAGQ